MDLFRSLKSVAMPLKVHKHSIVCFTSDAFLSSRLNHSYLLSDLQGDGQSEGQKQMIVFDKNTKKKKKTWKLKWL